MDTNASSASAWPGDASTRFRRRAHAAISGLVRTPDPRRSRDHPEVERARVVRRHRSIIRRTEFVDEPHPADRKTELIDPAKHLDRTDGDRIRDDELALSNAAVERQVREPHVRERVEARAARIAAVPRHVLHPRLHVRRHRRDVECERFGRRRDQRRH
jgi:hypothetical protein